MLHTQQLNYLLSLVPEGIVLLDEQKKISTLNERAEQLNLAHHYHHKRDLKDIHTQGHQFNSALSPIQIKVKNLFQDKKCFGGICHYPVLCLG